MQNQIHFSQIHLNQIYSWDKFKVNGCLKSSPLFFLYCITCLCLLPNLSNIPINKNIKFICYGNDNNNNNNNNRNNRNNRNNQDGKRKTYYSSSSFIGAFAEAQHLQTLTSLGGMLTDGCPTDFEQYSETEFVWSEGDDPSPENAIPDGYAFPITKLKSKISIDCYRTQTYYCPCKTGFGYFVSEDEVNVCCLQRDIAETFHLETNGVPDHFAQVVREKNTNGSESYETVLDNNQMFYDIPACPHKYIDLQNLNIYQDQYDRNALGDWPIGFATNGVPIYHPFGENGYNVNVTDFDRCGGSIRDGNQYVYYGQMPCLNYTGSDCRVPHVTGGFKDPSCTPLDGTEKFVVAGYAVDGFRIYQSNNTIFTDDELDNCNGKFTLNPTTGLYTYAYYVTQKQTYNQAYYPYVMGCLGPGKYYKNGSLIDYTGLQDLIDISCDYDIPIFNQIGLTYADAGFLYPMYAIAALIVLIGLVALCQQLCLAPLRRRKEMKFYIDRWHYIEQERMV